MDAFGDASASLENALNRRPCNPRVASRLWFTGKRVSPRDVGFLTSAALSLVLATGCFGDEFRVAPPDDADAAASSREADPSTQPVTEDGGPTSDGGPRDGPLEDGTCGDTFASEAPCVIPPARGIFLSPHGDDVNAGTAAAPVKTLVRALSLLAQASGAERRLYLCAAEGDAIDAGLPLGVDFNDAVIVGVGCTPNGDYTLGPHRVRLRAGGAAPVLTVTGVRGLRLVNLTLEARDATQPGGSSIALFARNALGLTLERCEVRAGTGARGTDGEDQPQAERAPNVSSRAGFRSDFPTCTCANGEVTTGGMGLGARRGNGGFCESVSPPQDPTSGTPQRLESPTRAGAPGRAGASAAALGRLTPDGFVPSDGAAGGFGQVGAGGSGAGFLGRDCESISGACGGCGGRGGGAGRGGGSSIGVAAIDTLFELRSTEVVAANAGDGGNGGRGEPGQPGGLGWPNASRTGGGAGGAGGAGGGGAGGMSVGVLHVGAPPAIDARSSVRAGAPGKGGTSTGGPAGIDGIAASVHALAP